MVFILNEQENKKQTKPSSRRHPTVKCASCGKSVGFPIIVLDQDKNAQFHPACAFKVAQTLMGDVMHFLLTKATEESS